MNLFYRREGAGPAVVMVHGSWGDHRNWDAVVPALAQEHEVIRYDRRGHSQSGPAPTPGTAEQDADDLLALIDRLQLDRPIVIASSFGASVTLKAGARAPQAFSAVVIHEPPLLGLVASHPIAGSQVVKVISHFHQNIVTLLETGRMEEGARVFMETVAFGPVAWDTMPDELKQTFIRNATTWSDELRDPEWSVVDLGALRHFDRPALVTSGSESPSFFGAIVDLLVPALPRARHVIFQGTGHVPHATHPDVYLPVVLPFLREVTARA